MVLLKVFVSVVMAGMPVVFGAAPGEPCLNQCQLAAKQARLHYVKELLLQSEAYAIQWKADCGCLERRQSYLNATRAYLRGASVANQDDGPVEPADTCPPWTQIGANYTETLRSVNSLSKVLDAYSRKCNPPQLLCEVWNQRIEDLEEEVTDGIRTLQGSLLSEDCQSASCDARLACRCPQDGQCKLSCNKFQLNQYWLQVARAENLKAREIFGQSRPRDCDDCCLLPRAISFGGLGHYFVSSFLINSIFPGGKQLKVIDQAIGSNCGDLANWESAVKGLASSTPLIDSFEALNCAEAQCSSDGVGSENGQRLALYYRQLPLLIGAVVDSLCDQNN